jgi:tRNA (mo5U34)-methyltransferase
MTTSDSPPDPKVLEAIRHYRWFQSFEVVPGVMSPGMFPIRPGQFLDEIGVPDDLAGSHTLDIGCMEGAIAFELERRGAASCAMDIQDPEDIAFNLVKRLRGSEVIYRRGSVYEVEAIFPKQCFDLIVYKGVYYHLKNPIGALEAIASVTGAGGRLIITGECLISFAVDLDGRTYDPALIRRIAESDVPLTLSYAGAIPGHSSSTWFVPNVACIRSWLSATGWELERYVLHDAPDARPRPGQRFVGMARRVDTSLRLEHPRFKWRT